MAGAQQRLVLGGWLIVQVTWSTHSNGIVGRNAGEGVLHWHEALVCIVLAVEGLACMCSPHLKHH